MVAASGPYSEIFLYCLFVYFYLYLFLRFVSYLLCIERSDETFPKGFGCFFCLCEFECAYYQITTVTFCVPLFSDGEKIAFPRDIFFQST